MSSPSGNSPSGNSPSGNSPSGNSPSGPEAKGRMTLGRVIMSQCEKAIDGVKLNSGVERDDAIQECALAAMEALQYGIEGVNAAILHRASELGHKMNKEAVMDDELKTYDEWCEVFAETTGYEIVTHLGLESEDQRRTNEGLSTVDNERMSHGQFMALARESITLPRKTGRV